MADAEDADEAGGPQAQAGSAGSRSGGADRMFSLKKWNAVAMWSWDVECDTCAICRVQVMGDMLCDMHLTGTVVSLADNSETVDRDDDVEDGQSNPMPALDVKLKTNKKIVLLSGENAIIPSTIAVCLCGLNRIIAVPSVNRTGWSKELANKSIESFFF